MLPLINERDIDEDVIWVTAGANRQALLLSRRDANGELSLRYLPISNLTQDASGRLQFKQISWQAGLPLQIFEDPNLNIPGLRPHCVAEPVAHRLRMAAGAAQNALLERTRRSARRARASRHREAFD